MNLGDTVLYVENGKEYNATVLGLHPLDDHFGSDNEPLLHLGFFEIPEKPGPDGIPRPVTLVGTHDQWTLAQFRLDVAHDSHSWNEKQQQKHGAKVYPGGRWKEISFSTFTGSVTEENPIDSVGSDPTDTTDGNESGEEQQSTEGNDQQSTGDNSTPKKRKKVKTEEQEVTE